MSIALITLPAARTGSRMPMAAMWLFVIPLLTEGVAVDVVKLELVGLAALAFTRIVVSEQVLPQRACRRSPCCAVLRGAAVRARHLAGATLALWIGVASCAASRLTGHLLLATPRMGACGWWGR
jgi:hypothetical protein